MQIPLVAYAVRERDLHKLAQTCTRKQSSKFCPRRSNYVLVKILLKLFSSPKEKYPGGKKEREENSAYHSEGKDDR